MFGFLSLAIRIPEWRRSYARICQHQRRLFGLTALPFLSYEATFLYQLAIDFGLIAALPNESPECCRLRRIQSSDAASEDVAVFAAAFGMMLAGVKLKDDVQDSGRWFNRLLAWKYRGAVHKANQIIGTEAPAVPQRIKSALAQHEQLELQTDISIEEYSDPTADGFSAVFEGLARQQNASADLIPTFADAGRYVGKALIAWDCAVDFERDRIRGDFNPLQNDNDVGESLEYSWLQLSRLGWLLPENSTSAKVVASVASRVRNRIQKPGRMNSVRRLERWGLIRQRGYSYARCDGCDCLCGLVDCSACMEGAGECGCCMSEGCVHCAPCGDCHSATKAAEKERTESESGDDAKTEPGPFAKFHGADGVTDQDLNPTGFVIINGERVAAKTASGKLVSANSDVRVVGTDPFGVTVVPKES